MIPFTLIVTARWTLISALSVHIYNVTNFLSEEEGSSAMATLFHRLMASFVIPGSLGFTNPQQARTVDLGMPYLNQIERVDDAKFHANLYAPTYFPIPIINEVHFDTSPQDRLTRGLVAAWQRGSVLGQLPMR
ncbi:hypothetical protein F5Y05DRAFT_362449 [Hypoxylon sp. FL0543]|nr:hypothetical protein F5Y05DRAFT_362449 [Hypoxylon sp. FL0543]